MQKIEAENKHKFSLGMFLVALGIVYGDIGTSPMYVMKSIVEGNGGITNVDQDFIVGSLSLVIWTITLLTTVKHVLIALRADNHGEGGIFALYSLIRNCGKWLIIPTMIGGCTMLADGVLTPAVTVSDYQSSVYNPAERNQFYRQDVRAGHDGVVSVSGHHGNLADPWRPFHLEGLKSGLCFTGPVQSSQQGGLFDFGQRVSVHHRCGSSVYGHGACGPEQYLHQLAVC